MAISVGSRCRIPTGGIVWSSDGSLPTELSLRSNEVSLRQLLPNIRRELMSASLVPTCDRTTIYERQHRMGDVMLAWHDRRVIQAVGQ